MSEGKGPPHEQPARRRFLKTAAMGLAAGALPTNSPATNPSSPDARTEPLAPPGEQTREREQWIPDGYSQDEADAYFVANPGSDFMVDVIKSLDIDYLAINAGSSFRGLQESVVNHGGNESPQIITCLHEEQAVALAHGYAKVSGRPIAVACHGTVGLQHAAMAIYNAWCDRAPVILLAGNHLDATQRLSFVSWAHSAQDAAHLVRDFTKWDDTPVSLPHFADSLVRAWQIATTPPMGPVVIVADAHLQEEAMVGSPAVPAAAPTIPPRGDDNAVREAARLLAQARAPVIVADRLARSQNGVDMLVQLAETLQAPVIDKGGRMNFPTNHPLCQTFAGRSLLRRADVILGLELNDTWGTLKRMRDLVHPDQTQVANPEAKVISIGSESLFLKPNYQNFQRFQPVTLAIAGDGEATLPGLIEAVRKELTDAGRARIAEREVVSRRAHEEMRKTAVDAARHGWDASPVSTARLYMEIWRLIRDRDWALTSGTILSGGWPQRLWDIRQHHQFIGDSGGYGVGYGAPASLGAALAHRPHGRFVVNVQADGDLMYGPGALWTAAHHGVPYLSVMHNNRGYHQEVMHLQRMTLRRQRGGRPAAEIGNTFDEPRIDYAQLAASMGVWSSGPVTNPADLSGVLTRAAQVVDSGEPALVDVRCQPR